ncbi:MAG TPA: PAS domain-containing sensor histidine kinase [Candidatus Methylomirabilis sp.]|nr:PAS domain-containing sensor histidine kinase [Candidatus Methylomirabilis sp.]
MKEDKTKSHKSADDTSLIQKLEVQNKKLLRKQRELEESRNRFSDLYDFAPVGYFTFDKSGIITEVNLTGANKLGIERDFLIHKPFSLFISPDSKEMFYLHLQHVFMSNTRQTCELKLVDKNGVQSNARLESLSVQDGKESTSHCRVIVSDITECETTEKRIQNALSYTESITEQKKFEELRLENERLISANKARSDFLTIMSHELRTPLTTVIGYLIILQGNSHGKLNKKQRFFVDNILTSSKHLLGLINGILDLAKIEAGKLEMVFEEICVSDTINEILKVIKENAAKHNIVLKKKIDPRLPIIEADRRALKQIFFNLLSNAIKFNVQKKGVVTVSANKEGDMVKISVSDTGIGIRKEDIPRLFQKFEQLDTGISRKYEGTGLGLVITKQLVELHGGKITVESKYGEGSTFTFLLPAGKKKL